MPSPAARRAARRSATLALIAGLTILTSVCSPLEAQTPVRLGYLDSRRILAAVPGLDAAQRRLEDELGALRRDAAAAEDSARALAERLQRQAEHAAPDARPALEARLQRLGTEYEQRIRELDTRAESRRVALVQPYIERVRRAVEEERAEGGYVMLFDVATGDGALVDADAELDVTERVIERVRAAIAASPIAVAPAAPTTAPRGTGSRPSRP